MRILLTNDDGFDAPGMKILLDIAQHFSNDLGIVAPSDENSGAGHSLTITRPLRIRKRGDQQYSVDGTPTDSVMMAVAKIMKDGPPDLILSGVNRGANLGEDVTYSGTVSTPLCNGANGFCGHWSSNAWIIVRWSISTFRPFRQAMSKAYG
mgnify:CR=1 FL=1